MANINILSLNTRGRRDGNKRREIFRWLKRYYKADKTFTFMQETHSSISDEEMWKNEWGSNIMFSHGANDARGVAILFPADISDSSIEETWSDNNGRICMVKIKAENDTVCLINVYAPTKNNQKPQLDFVEKLQELLSNNEESSMVVAGDFNTYLDSLMDKEGGKIEPTSKYTDKLNNLIETFNLVDVWRVYNPNTRRYTWRQNNPLVQSRLDYILLSLNLMQNVKQCDIKPSIKTDHSLVTLNMNLKESIKRGPGFWKFNASLLKDEVYIDHIKETISHLKEQCVDIENKGLKWDYIKSEIRQRTIIYSKTQARLRHDNEEQLKIHYNNFANDYVQTQDPNIHDEIENVKAQIEHINKEKTAGSQIRAKALALEDENDA